MPVRKEGEVLLKIKRIGVCGTDIHAFGGTQPYFEYPRILGHELAAKYIEGNVSGFISGDKVTFIPYFHCGQCVACRNGLTNCCANIKVFGVHIDGGMAQYVTIPEQYLLHGQGLDYDDLALVEPLAIAAHGVRRAKVVVMDVNDYRLGFCKKELQANEIINPLNEDVVARLKKITNGDMPTVVIDATGNRNVMNTAFNYIAHGGRFVLVGLQKGELAFNHPDFHKRESTLMSSRNATIQDFEYVMECIKEGKIYTKKYITHRVNFAEMIPEFEKWIDPKNNVIKAMIELD
jgi:threonine dehydrogenase-like Zn-dependent dehydrogenase